MAGMRNRNAILVLFFSFFISFTSFFSFFLHLTLSHIWNASLMPALSSLPLQAPSPNITASWQWWKWANCGGTVKADDARNTLWKVLLRLGWGLNDIWHSVKKSLVWICPLLMSMACSSHQPWVLLGFWGSYRQNSWAPEFSYWKANA